MRSTSPNALLLDQAEFAVDDGPWQAREEILRAAEKCFAMLGWPVGDDFATLCQGAERSFAHGALPFQHPQRSPLRRRPSGGRMPRRREDFPQRRKRGSQSRWLVCGQVPCHLRAASAASGRKHASRGNALWPAHQPGVDVSAGDFAVVLRGRQARLAPREDCIGFGSIAEQGFPFYGGNISYEIPFESQGGEVTLRAAHYRGATMKIALDGKDLGLLTLTRLMKCPWALCRRANTRSPLRSLVTGATALAPCIWRMKMSAGSARPPGTPLAISGRMNTVSSPSACSARPFCWKNRKRKTYLGEPDVCKWRLAPQTKNIFSLARSDTAVLCGARYSHIPPFAPSGRQN